MDEKTEFMKEVIYKNRKKKQLTQEQLADMLNVSNKTISKWERGIGYPDVQIIPTLAKVLDIPIQSLFNAEDLKPESIGKYNHSMITKYKQRMILSFILILFSPILYLVSAFIMQRSTVISIYFGIVMIAISIVNVILLSIKMYDFIATNYKNEKYKQIFKNYLLIYSFIIFIPSILLTVLFKQNALSICMSTLMYALFIIIPLFVVQSLQVNMKKKRNILFFTLSIVLFIIGLFLMIYLEILPYILFYIFSQLTNYIMLFISKDIDK